MSGIENGIAWPLQKLPPDAHYVGPYADPLHGGQEAGVYTFSGAEGAKYYCIQVGDVYWSFDAHHLDGNKLYREYTRRRVQEEIPRF